MVTAAYFVHTEVYRVRRFRQKGGVVKMNDTQHDRTKPRKWGWFILLTSSATLVCCVIPIVLVGLGMGAVVAALYGNLSFLTFLGLHKGWVFLFSALILAVAAYALFRPGRTCPADPELAKACESADKWNQRLFWVSVAVWLTGFFAAYLLLPVTERLG